MATAPDRDDLDWLLASRDGLCVSLSVPTHRAGASLRQDPIRFKNLLTDAERQLVRAGTRTVEARRRLEPARLLAEDGSFWRHRDHGLAMFISPDSDDPPRYWDLPTEPPERAMVAPHFVVRPLLSLLGRADRYYVLSLSQKRIVLYRGHADGLDEQPLPGAPQGIEDLMRFIEPEKQLQLHTGTASDAGPAGDRQAMFHGQGTDDTRENKRVHELFRALDGALRRRLRSDDAPLIPAGVEWVLSIFRATTTLNNVTRESVHGSFDQASVSELAERVRPVVNRLLDTAQDEAIARYRTLRDSPRTSREVAAIVRLALLGQIELLLVDHEAQRWGIVADDSAVHVHESQQPHDRDLVELAVLHVLRTGGRVHVLPSDQMPDSSAVAAVVRPGAVATSSARSDTTKD